MAREITDGIYLIQECNDRMSLTEQYQENPPDWYVDGKTVHSSQSAYLFVGEETLLFDTLSPAAREHVLTEVDEVLDGRSLDYLVVSHPEAPHAGNAQELCEAHPEATLIAPDYGNTHDLYYLDDATQVAPGTVLEVGEFELEVIDPVFVDHKMHIWLFDRTTETLFTVDWLGLMHMEGECLTLADELDEPVARHRLELFHGRALFWFEYADLAKVDAAIEDLIETYDPAVLAPAHGFVVREDTAGYMRNMKSVVRSIAEERAVSEAW